MSADLGEPRDMDLLTETPSLIAPETYAAELETTRGTLRVEIHRAWAPRGAERFYNLLRLGYYDGCRFFRVVPDFVAQCGIHPRPEVNKFWKKRTFQDDPVVLKNDAGTLTFATSGVHARTTQFFINLRNNARLDALGFAPLGRLVDLQPALQLYNGYGEGPPGGTGPQQGRLHREGEAYLAAEFPRLDTILHARVVDESHGGDPSSN